MPIPWDNRGEVLDFIGFEYKAKCKEVDWSVSPSMGPNPTTHFNTIYISFKSCVFSKCFNMNYFEICVEIFVIPLPAMYINWDSLLFIVVRGYSLLFVVARTEEIQFLAMRFLWVLWLAAALLYLFLQVKFFRARYYEELPVDRTDDPRAAYLPKRKRRS